MPRLAFGKTEWLLPWYMSVYRLMPPSNHWQKSSRPGVPVGASDGQHRRLFPSILLPTISWASFQPKSQTRVALIWPTICRHYIGIIIRMSEQSVCAKTIVVFDPPPGISQKPLINRPWIIGKSFTGWVKVGGKSRVQWQINSKSLTEC